MNQKLTLTRERISRLVDMRVDGIIDVETYSLKLEGYKRELQEATDIVQNYKGGKVERLATEEILKLAQQAGSLFMSSSFEEKRQLLGFFTSNLRLNSEKLDVELREPFRTLAQTPDQHIWRD